MTQAVTPEEIAEITTQVCWRYQHMDYPDWLTLTENVPRTGAWIRAWQKTYLDEQITSRVESLRISKALAASV